MPDVYGWVFQADIGVDEALRRLQGVEGYTFAIRESYHEGRYVNGTDARGIRIRVLGEERVRDLELYFPSAQRGAPLGADERQPVLESLIPSLLTRLGATGGRAD